MAKESIIIDCDPGQDDALAILLALGSPEEIEVLAVTAVAGNVPLSLTEVNARKMVELAGRADVPVYRGADRPLVRDLVTAEFVHGKTGLDGADLPAPSTPLADGHAALAITDILRREPAGTVTLCPIGPLTNIALAMRLAPDIIARIKAIVLMGGAIGVGNITPAAEFNIHVDPHAADIVFRSGVPVVMHGLDVTHKALVTPSRLAAIRDIGTVVSEAVHGLLSFYNKFDQAKGEGQGAPLHDPCAIAYVMRPDLFEGRDCHVEIEITSEASMGRTLVDWRGRSDKPVNAFVVDQIDADGFFELLTERLARLPLSPNR
ncbi:MAG: nucleoside hydrolase [Alphaproteobacteria bacterium]|nr:nucleoside hydrolase [Alphaproteobacteria bacterium]